MTKFMAYDYNATYLIFNSPILKGKKDDRANN